MTKKIGSALDGVTGYFNTFGEEYAQTFGQTFKTPDGTNTTLTSFSFWIKPESGTTKFQGYLAEWTGDKAGEILWHSGDYALTPDGTNQKTVFNGIGVELDASKTYVFFTTVSNLLDGVPDEAGFAGSSSQTEQYTDGHVVYFNNTNSDQLTSSPWNGASHYPIDDLEFLADFSPSTTTLTVETSANENGKSAFVLTTKNVAAGTEIPFDLSGTISDADVLGGLSTGSFVIEDDGTATFPIKYIEDRRRNVDRDLAR